MSVREAPSVVVFSEMGRKCWTDPDSEHRLAFVAATRTQGPVELCMKNRLEWTYCRYDYPDITRHPGASIVSSQRRQNYKVLLSRLGQPGECRPGPLF